MENLKEWIKLHWWEYVVIINMFIILGGIYLINDFLVPYGKWALIVSFFERIIIFLAFVIGLVLFFKDIKKQKDKVKLKDKFWSVMAIFILFIFSISIFEIVLDFGDESEVLITDDYYLRIGGRGILSYRLHVEGDLNNSHSRGIPIKRNLYYLLKNADEEYDGNIKIKISYWKRSHVIENIEIIY